MKYSNLTWGLIAVMAVLMVAAIGSNMGYFAFGALGLNADVYQEGDLILVDYTYTSVIYNNGRITTTFAGETKTITTPHGPSSGTITFVAPVPGTYEMVVSAHDEGMGRYELITANHVTKTFDVVVVGNKPIDYCVGNALYTDFELVGTEWKPTPVINSPICGYTAPPPDEPPINITTPSTDSPMSTTKMMLIAFIGILIVWIGAIIYSKRR